MRIVIAEDSAVVRAGLVEILADRGHQVLAAVGNAEDLLAAVDEHHPDVTVVDVRMPPGYTDEGLRAAIAIRRDHPGTGVVVFSQYIETRSAADLLGAASGRGAAGVGYLLKDRVADVGEFVEALSRVAAGGTALDPEVVTQLLGASRRTDGLGSLTARERDVLALMAEGRSNSAIAAIIVVSERAVEKHVGNIFSKLGLAPSDADHRRVLAVLRYLESLPATPPIPISPCPLACARPCSDPAPRAPGRRGACSPLLCYLGGVEQLPQHRCSCPVLRACP
jgi:DNA-binding NarL/FixJ family response regulator